MNKQTLISFINKYHLNGNITKILINSTEDSLHCKFISDTKALIGDLTMNNISFDKECNTGIYDTSQFLKLLTALNDEIKINVFTVEDQSVYIELSDDSKKAKFILSHPDILPTLPKDINLPTMDFEFEIDDDFIINFIKSKNALDATVNTFTFVKKDNKLKIILNYQKDNHATNTISFDVNDLDVNLEHPITFNADFMKEILLANKNDFDIGSIMVSSKGLMQIAFKSEEYNSKYFLVANV